MDEWRPCCEPRYRSICATLSFHLCHLSILFCKAAARYQSSRDPKTLAEMQRWPGGGTVQGVEPGRTPPFREQGWTGALAENSPMRRLHREALSMGKQSQEAREERDEIPPGKLVLEGEPGQAGGNPTRSWQLGGRWVPLSLSLGACASSRGGPCPQRPWGSCRSRQSCPRG